MAYMSQETKKKISPGIKAVLAKYGVKGTIGVRDSSVLVVNLTGGKLDLIGDANKYNQMIAEQRGAQPIKVDGHYQANPYWPDNNYSEQVKSFFRELVNAMNGKGTTVENYDNSDSQSDYFDVGWYLNINVGKWDKPYAYYTG